MTLTSEVRDTPSGADEPGPNGTGAPTNGGAATVAFPAQPPGEKPVEFWSTSAIRTALENDDLAVWQRIVVAIKRDPFGRTARQVEEILATTNPYGISKALSEVLARALPQDVQEIAWDYPEAFFAPTVHAVPRPRALVTTPFHLRALLDAGVAVPPLDFILSATAPLSEDLARRAEAALGAPLLEIYGCTETGQLASRRSTATRHWHLLGDVRLSPLDDRHAASGGHIDPDLRPNLTPVHAHTPHRPSYREQLLRSDSRALRRRIGYRRLQMPMRPDDESTALDPRAGFITLALATDLLHAAWRSEVGIGLLDRKPRGEPWTPKAVSVSVDYTARADTARVRQLGGHCAVRGPGGVRIDGPTGPGAQDGEVRQWRYWRLPTRIVRRPTRAVRP